MKQNKDDIATIMTVECGKPLAQSKGEFESGYGSWGGAWGNGGGLWLAAPSVLLPAYSHRVVRDL